MASSPGAGAADRPARPGSASAADINAVIDIFSAQRLLVLGEEQRRDLHDALLQAWTRLRDWLEDDQLDRSLYGQVITDADAWDANRRDSSYLYQPRRLAAMDTGAKPPGGAARAHPLPPPPATAQAFLDAAHHAARRSTRRRRSGFAILALLTALALAASASPSPSARPRSGNVTRPSTTR